MGNVTADDVYLTTGCSMAFEIAVRTLANSGMRYKNVEIFF